LRNGTGVYFLAQGVQFLGPDKSAIAFNLVPVSTLLVSLILGTLPNAIQLVGMLLELIGVVISSGWHPSGWRPSGWRPNSRSKK